MKEEEEKNFIHRTLLSLKHLKIFVKKRTRIALKLFFFFFFFVFVFLLFDQFLPHTHALQILINLVNLNMRITVRNNDWCERILFFYGHSWWRNKWFCNNARFIYNPNLVGVYLFIHPSVHSRLLTVPLITFLLVFLKQKKFFFRETLIKKKRKTFVFFLFFYFMCKRCKCVKVRVLSLLFNNITVNQWIQLNSGRHIKK